MEIIKDKQIKEIAFEKGIDAALSLHKRKVLNGVMFEIICLLRGKNPRVKDYKPRSDELYKLKDIINKYHLMPELIKTHDANISGEVL